MQRETPTFIAVTRVRPERHEDFERFVKDVVAPAVQEVRPHLTGQAQLFRPAQEQPYEGVPAYVFAFYGGAPPEDWNLHTIFLTAYGDEEGGRRSQEFHDFLEDPHQTTHWFDGEVPTS